MVLTITKGGSDQLSPHFLESEWYSTSSDAPASHPIDSRLVEAAELLRTHYDTPWRITSAYRTEAHERQILKALDRPFFVSQHMKGRAFDSQPANGDRAVLAALVNDLTTAGPLYQALRKIGISGFGVYDTFVHLDCRSDSFTAGRRDAFGLVARWDERSKKVKGQQFRTQKPPLTSPTFESPRLGASPGGCSR